MPRCTRIAAQRLREEALDPGKYDRAATILQARWRGGSYRNQRRIYVAEQAEDMWKLGVLAGRWRGKAKATRLAAASRVQSRYRGHRVREANRQVTCTDSLTLLHRLLMLISGVTHQTAGCGEASAAGGCHLPPRDLGVCGGAGAARPAGALLLLLLPALTSRGLTVAPIYLASELCWCGVQLQHDFPAAAQLGQEARELHRLAEQTPWLARETRASFRRSRQKKRNRRRPASAAAALTRPQTGVFGLPVGSEI